MKSNFFRRWRLALTGVALATLLTAAGVAADRPSKNADVATVELFDGIRDGQIEVKYIPHDDKEGQLIVKNVSDKPLSVKLPEIFAAAPILAQIGGGAGNRGGGLGGGAGGGGQNQAVGGGGGGFGGGGGGGGFNNIAPEKIAKMKIETVCLEHGKAEPNPRVSYEIKSFDSYSSDAVLGESLKLMTEGKVSQRVAQVAAWHLANGLTWDQLAAKKIHHLTGPDESYFSGAEVKQAMLLVKEAEKRADAIKAKTPAVSTTTASVDPISTPPVAAATK